MPTLWVVSRSTPLVRRTFLAFMPPADFAGTVEGKQGFYNRDAAEGHELPNASALSTAKALCQPDLNSASD